MGAGRSGSRAEEDADGLVLRKDAVSRTRQEVSAGFSSSPVLSGFLAFVVWSVKFPGPLS